MKTLLKGFVRLVGTVSGIEGLCVMIVGVFTTVAFFQEPKHGFDVFLGIFECVAKELIGAYLTYVAFVVWRRFSPAAIHHVCAVLGFLLFALLLSFVSLPDNPPAPGMFVFYVLVFVGFGAVSYLAFRLCRLLLQRTLFPTQAAYPVAGGNAVPPHASA